MKNHILGSALFAAAALSSNARAADVTFYFLVNSSGSDIYACDAGLLDGSGQSYVQGSVTSSATASVAVLANQLPLGNNFRTLVYENGFTNGSSVKDKFSHSIAKGAPTPTADELTFNLASQRYGASYFVDFCFRGSKLGYPSGKNFKYKIYDGVTAQDMDANLYLSNALVKVEAKVVCDPRVDASPSTTPSDNWALTRITDSFASSLLGLDGSGTVGVSKPTSPAVPPTLSSSADYPSFSAGSYTNLFGTAASPTTLASSGLTPAKYCVIRYLFTETSTAQRVWDIKQAKFAIYLNVESLPN